MTHKKALLLVAILALAMALAAASGVLAQTSAHYNLTWHVIGGGGQPVTSAHYAVNSTAGQGAASPPYSTSAHYVVSGGYWFVGEGAREFLIYLPLVMRDGP